MALRPAERKTGDRPWIWPTLAGLVGLVFAAPFAYLALGTLTQPLEVVTEILSAETLGPLWNSLRLAVSVATVTATIGTATAWLVSRTNIGFRRFWLLAAPLPLVVPSFIGASALLAVLGPGGLLASTAGVEIPQLDGFWGSLVVLSVLTYPLVHLIVTVRLDTLPASLEEGARLLGSRPVVVFRNVVWPQVSRGVLASSVLVFLYVLSDFGAVSLLRYDTLTRVIFAGRLFDPEGSLARALLLGIIALTAVWLSRRLRPSSVEPTQRGRPPARYHLGRWGILAQAFLATVMGLGVIAPVIVFSYWSVRGINSGGLPSPAQLLEPVAGTLTTGVLAGMMAVVIVFPVARASRATGRWSAAVVTGTFAIPGLVLALALSFYALAIPGWIVLYQTLPLLLAGYVIHFGAQGLTALEDGLGSVPERLGEAARTLGASPGRRFWTVEAPMLLPSTLAGGGLVMLSTMKELPMTLLLSPPGFSTLATQVWGAAEGGFLAKVGVGSLVLIGLSGVLTWLLVLRPSRSTVAYSSVG